MKICVTIHWKIPLGRYGVKASVTIFEKFSQRILLRALCSTKTYWIIRFKEWNFYKRLFWRNSYLKFWYLFFVVWKCILQLNLSLIQCAFVCEWNVLSNRSTTFFCLGSVKIWNLNSLTLTTKNGYVYWKLGWSKLDLSTDCDPYLKSESEQNIG